MIDRVKEVDSFDGLLLDGARLGEPVEGTDTGREVVERCEVRQIAAACAADDIPRANKVVVVFFVGAGAPVRGPLPRFPLRWGLQKEGPLVFGLLRGTEP